jgi:deferrochelatase/peroxidase EfeB
MSSDTSTTLELDDIQAGVLRGRPTPYAGAILLLRIDDPHDGRTLAGRLADVVQAAADVLTPETDTSISVALTYAGLATLGVPPASLDTFPTEFQEGMAARAGRLGDVGAQAPGTWETPLGSKDVHVIVAVLAPDQARFEAALATARDALHDLPGITLLWRQDVWAPADGRNSLDFRDGISQPDVEGSGLAPSNPLERPIKAGEFVLGQVDETGNTSPVPQPDALGRNGSYMVFRKLYTDVAAFRRYIHGAAQSEADATRVAAKIVGRWPSGARSRWHRTKTTRNSAPTTLGTTPFCMATTRRASSARSARTSGARTHATASSPARCAYTASSAAARRMAPGSNRAS